MTINKEAIQYLQESAVDPKNRIVEKNNRMFQFDSEGNGKEILPRSILAANPLNLNTLTGLINYIKSNLERQTKKLYLHVLSEKIVQLVGCLEEDGRREVLVISSAITPEFPFGRYLNAEEFIINFQSKFLKNNDRDILLKVIGNVVEENVKNTGDDGISQSVEIRSGITSRAEVKVPNPVKLAPYRTFSEVEQPTSDFVFRMKEGPLGAIFEADGGAWRNNAIVNVREYLKEELEKEISEGKITLLA